MDPIFNGFSKLSYEERLNILKKSNFLTADDIQFLKAGGIQSIELGEKFIENTLGYFQLPLGVATHFTIDSKNYLIPMAVEETSIIAAASKTAKWVNQFGQIKTEVIGSDIIGQIQFAKIKSPLDFKDKILKAKNQLIEMANKEVAFGLVQRGGGVTDIKVRLIDREENLQNEMTEFMGVVHVLMNPCDAMGANIINQVCEFLKAPLQELTTEEVTMCILSNLVDTKITRAKITLKGIDPDLAYKIAEASKFAELDPYRAATNNKGVLNGMDPIVIATGNDWRAVEAGVHAYATRSGQYRSITRWTAENDELVGVLEAPIVVGIVGGVTTLHPMAKMSMRMLNVVSANELSKVIAAVGLVQNLGALKALTTVGIIEGHMKLHIKNLSLGAGATEIEMPFVVSKLEEILTLRKRITLSNAIEVLNELRSQSKKVLNSVQT